MICERITVELDAAGTGSRWYRRNRKKATARSPFIVVRCLFLLHFFDGLGLGLCVCQVSLSAASSPVHTPGVLVCVCARCRSQRPQALSTPQKKVQGQLRHSRFFSLLMSPDTPRDNPSAGSLTRNASVQVLYKIKTFFLIETLPRGLSNGLALCPLRRFYFF